MSDQIDQLSVVISTNVEKALAEMRHFQAETANAARHLASSIGTIEKDFSRAGKAAGGFGSTLASVARTITGFTAGLAATFGAGYAAKGLVDLADAAEDTQEKLDSLLGPQASARVSAWAESFGKSAGRSSRALRQSALDSVLLAKEMGLTGDQAAEYAIKIEELANNLAALRGVDPTSAQQAIQGALKSQTRGLKTGFDIRIEDEDITRGLRAMNIPEWASKGEKALGALNIVLARTSHLQGQAAKESLDFSAQWSQFIERVTDIGAVLGGVVLEPVSRMLKNINAYLRDSTVALERFLAPAKEAAATIAAAVETAFKDPAKGMEWLRRGWAALVDDAKHLARQLADIFAEAIIAGVKRGMAEAANPGEATQAGIDVARFGLAPGQAIGEWLWGANKAAPPGGPAPAAGGGATAAFVDFLKNQVAGAQKPTGGFSGAVASAAAAAVQAANQNPAIQALKPDLPELGKMLFGDPLRRTLDQLTAGIAMAPIDLTRFLAGTERWGPAPAKTWEGGQIVGVADLGRMIQQQALKPTGEEKAKAEQKARDEARNKMLEASRQFLEGIHEAVKNGRAVFRFE